MESFRIVKFEVTPRYSPQEDELIRSCMLENLEKGERVYVAAINTAEQIRDKFGIKRSPVSIERRWHIIKHKTNKNQTDRDETAAYVASLARKISALERHIAEQDRLIQSLLRQLEIASRCIALLKGGDVQ